MSGILTSPRWIVPLIRFLATGSYMNSSISGPGSTHPRPRGGVPGEGTRSELGAGASSTALRWAHAS